MYVCMAGMATGYDMFVRVMHTYRDYLIRYKFCAGLAWPLLY